MVKMVEGGDCWPRLEVKRNSDLSVAGRSFWGPLYRAPTLCPKGVVKDEIPWRLISDVRLMGTVKVKYNGAQKAPLKIGYHAPATTTATLEPTLAVRNTTVGTRVPRRPQRHDPLIQLEFSESDDDAPHQRFDFSHFDSDEEPAKDPYHRRRYRGRDSGFSDFKAELQLSRTSRNSYAQRYGPDYAIDPSKGSLPPQISKPSPLQSQSKSTTFTSQDSKLPVKLNQLGRENPYPKPGPLKCFHCFQPSHKSNDCPN
ncbi:Zinc finger, CCHC-type [Parasponia andersonii]|uniref:Zinc finger, CCHC-type n=1 Tax=Parasponia andersonii TaxID=3476 RepID=A0A2P5DK67_PARAD|nr:Zinc finger, CCHC-type [Parasponia andersonii]